MRPLSVIYPKTERGHTFMQQKIIITEVNKPSITALKAFNQYVFNAIQNHYNSHAQEKAEVKSS